MSRIILAIDQGTTGTTVLLLTSDLTILTKVNREFPQIYPQPGWVEHDPEAIWGCTVETIKDALESANVEPSQIGAIGITNQRETTVIWDRKTDKPIYNAIVWQCRRTADICAGLKAEGLENRYRSLTGLVLDPYFSGTKIKWILDHVDGARRRAEAGELAFGTIDSFLLWRLTGSAVHATDISNASRTLLMNLAELRWDPELTGPLKIPHNMLPEIRGNSEVYGVTKNVPGLPDGIPIAGMAGDQQSALFGQACFNAGEAKCTYGTGAFLLMNTGDKVVPSAHGMLSTAGWKIGNKVTFALEGSAFIAGALVQWLRDGLKIIDSAPEIEELAASVENSGGVVIVPALAGLGAPHWNPEARGVIHGITRGTTRAHIARAALEGIAFQNYDILSSMVLDLGKQLKELKVDGGAAANNVLMQFQADILGVDIVRPAMLETTAFGAAFLAGLGVGLFTDLDEIRSVWKQERVFSPGFSQQEREHHLARWSQGVCRV